MMMMISHFDEKLKSLYKGFLWDRGSGGWMVSHHDINFAPLPSATITPKYHWTLTLIIHNHKHHLLPYHNYHRHHHHCHCQHHHCRRHQYQHYHHNITITIAFITLTNIFFQVLAIPSTLKLTIFNRARVSIFYITCSICMCLKLIVVLPIKR